jgi:hypothetical protein
MRICSTPMGRVILHALALATAAALLSGCGVQNVRSTTSSAPVSGLCGVLATPTQLGAVVSFQAIASTDLHHGITLRDPACPNTGLRVGPPAEDADQSVERFLGQLRVLAPHLAWRSALGSFTGRITLNASGERRVALLAARDFQEVADEP